MREMAECGMLCTWRNPHHVEVGARLKPIFALIRAHMPKAGRRTTVITPHADAIFTSPLNTIMCYVC